MTGKPQWQNLLAMGKDPITIRQDSGNEWIGAILCVTFPTKRLLSLL